LKEKLYHNKTEERV